MPVRLYHARHKFFVAANFVVSSHAMKLSKILWLWLRFLRLWFTKFAGNVYRQRSQTISGVKDTLKKKYTPFTLSGPVLCCEMLPSLFYIQVCHLRGVFCYNFLCAFEILNGAKLCLHCTTMKKIIKQLHMGLYNVTNTKIQKM